MIPEWKIVSKRSLLSICLLTIPLAAYAVIFYNKTYNKSKRKMSKEKNDEFSMNEKPNVFESNIIDEDDENIVENNLTNELTLTKEEIREILLKSRGNEDFEILDFNLNQFKEKIGLLGDHMKLNIKTQILSEEPQEKEFNFFVKFQPFSSKSQLKFSIESGAFKKEIFTYQLLEKIKKSSNILDSTPKCYLSDEDRLIVFEDLSERNLETVDKMRTLNYEEITIILNSLAKLHVSSIIYEEKLSEELGRNFRLNEEYQEEFEETFFNDKTDFINSKGIKASLRGLLSEIDLFEFTQTLQSGKNFKDVLTEMFDKICELVKSKDLVRNVLCHGDLWSANFLLRYNKNRPVDCIFVDFQQSRYKPPSHDLMSLIYLNTTREFRVAHMYELIGTYYAKLEKFLKLNNLEIGKIWSFQDFLASCEEQKLFAMLQTATYFQLVLADDGVLKKIFNSPKLSEKILNEDRTPLIIKNIEISDEYKKRLKDSVSDLLDYCQYL